MLGAEVLFALFTEGLGVCTAVLPALRGVPAELASMPIPTCIPASEVSIPDGSSNWMGNDAMPAVESSVIMTF